jgi:hypothetical protein
MLPAFISAMCAACDQESARVGALWMKDAGYKIKDAE